MGERGSGERAGKMADNDTVKKFGVRRRRARRGEPRKKAVSIRLSPEVLAYFKNKGPGWQTRIDRILKALVTALD